jgi:hypothetical protein
VFFKFRDMWYVTGRGCQPLAQPHTWRTGSLFLRAPEAGVAQLYSETLGSWDLGRTTSRILIFVSS